MGLGVRHQDVALRGGVRDAVAAQAWDAALACRDGPLLSMEVILECQPPSLGPSSLQGLIPWDCIKQIPKEVKVCSPEVQCCDLDFCPATSPQDSELHCSQGCL